MAGTGLGDMVSVVSSFAGLPAGVDEAWFPLVIAVDGPSGVGKSTQSRTLAATLGLAYLDTGAMYRAAAWWCQDQGVDLSGDAAHPDEALAAVQRMSLVMSTDPADQPVLVGGTDVTAAIRTPELSAVVSKVAVVPEVREVLITEQRRYLKESQVPPGRGMVAEGRDVTSVVAPDADVRILLTADAQARADRRAAELAAAGGGENDAGLVESTRAAVDLRDQRDSAASNFMTAGDGVTEFDSSTRRPEETEVALLEIVKQTCAARAVR